MKPTQSIAAVFISLGVLAVSACGLQKTTEAPILKVIDVPDGTQAKPLALKRIVLKIPRRKVVGKYSTGLGCVNRYDLTVRGGRYNLNTNIFDGLFRQELLAAN